MPEGSAVAADVTRVAREQFGWEHLRDGQAEAMAALVGGRDVLLVMPTGGGKSAVYQVPAVLRPGPTIVVSPLLALQEDQIAAVRGSGQTAARLSSAETAAERASALDEVAAGRIEFLYTTPETLADPAVLDRLAAARPSLVAVDEAHCVSTWGHDFRPDYLQLGHVVTALGRPPVVALTATAAPPVREDVVRRLGLRDPVVLVRGLDRPNLALDVARHADERGREVAVRELVAGVDEGSAIVYTATRRDTERWRELLGDGAVAYHGGMPARERTRIQDAFMSGAERVVVATSAFGMGIDKPDVRLVAHVCVPDSLDSYLQESGRAGRDGRPATAALHFRDGDWGLRRFLISAPPDAARVGAVLRSLRSLGSVSRTELAGAVSLRPQSLGRVLALLEEVGAVRRDARRVRPVGTTELDDAVAAAVAEAERHRTVERSRLEMVRAFVEARTCRRQLLLGYFGEQLDQPCGNCDTCWNGSAYENSVDPDVLDHLPFAAGDLVRHAVWGEGTVMSADDTSLVVLFGSVGYKTLSLDTVLERGLLSPARTTGARSSAGGRAARATG